MKIQGGIFRGRNLAKAGPGLSIRPTAAKVRGSIFDILVNGKLGNIVEGARVLDLFAGTGALGIEALSRGAAHAAFVDIEPSACGLIRRNLELVGAADQAVLLRCDACRLGRNRREPFDVVFLDPPYGRGLAPRALSAVIENGWLADEGIAVVEEAGTASHGKAMEAVESKSYGDTAITFLRRVAGAQSACASAGEWADGPPGSGNAGR